MMSWQPLAAQDLLWNLMIMTLLQLRPISLTTLLQGELHLLNIDNTPCYKVSNKLLNELYQFLLYINLFLWMFLVRSPGLLYITKGIDRPSLIQNRRRNRTVSENYLS